MKTTRAFIAALVLGCLCSIVSADVAAHKADTSSAAAQHPDPAAHSDPSPPHPHPKAHAAAAHDPTVATSAAAAIADVPSAKVSSPHSTTTTTSPPVCGNGIIEHGEECDCGSPQECAKDPCCNGKTCKLNAGAQCSNQQECCDKCQFRPSTFTCRSATSDCDAVEMCSGKSAKCPANKTTCPKSHSTVPSNSSISCGAELCTERDLQCQSQSDSGYMFATACAATTSSCQISCTDPTDAAASSNSPRCVGLLVNFEDGTACGQGGVCSSGVCNGDKSKSAFFKKNTVTFAVGGGCIVVAFFFCFFGIICSRRRKRLQKEKERKQEDSYQMSETNDRDLYRKSNIRIGLDPSYNGMVDVLMPYDGSQGNSSLTRRPSAGVVNANTRAGGSRSTGPYAADSLMTEQEMVLDLESNANKRMGPTVSNWPAPPGSRERTGYFDTPPPSHPLPAINATGSKGKGTLQKSPSVGNHIVYVPPPLPPPAITTPTSKLPGVISPYADEAMIVFPPDSPPRPGNSSGGSKKPSNHQAPIIRIGEVATSSSQRPGGTTPPDDEPSFLDLNNSLCVDRYRTDGKSAAKDRTSVNSFFSGLAMDEPTPESYSLPPILPEPSFASEEYVMPAPIARVIPVPTPHGVSPSPSSPSSSLSNKPKSAYERQQEDIQVASCFAQDLGFEIVHPSPTGSPRHKAATPTGSRRL